MIGNTLEYHRVFETMGGGMGIVCKAENTMLRFRISAFFVPFFKAESSE